MTEQASMADELARVYTAYLDSLTDDDAERRWRLDGPSDLRLIVSALERIGSPVWWLDHEPTSVADDRPLMVAGLDESTGEVRFFPETADVMAIMPAAWTFDPWGESLVHG